MIIIAPRLLAISPTAFIINSSSFDLSIVFAVEEEEEEEEEEDT